MLFNGLDINFVIYIDHIIVKLNKNVYPTSCRNYLMTQTRPLFLESFSHELWLKLLYNLENKTSLNIDPSSCMLKEVKRLL